MKSIRKPIKTRVVLVLLSLSIFSGCNDNSEKKQQPLSVYLLLGQSNMVGMRSDPSKLPMELTSIQSDSLFFKDGKWVPIGPGVTEDKGFGPEISFSKNMTEHNKIGIIKISAGNTTLDKEWNSDENGELYIKTLSVIHEAEKTRKIKIDGVLWMQGESDGATLERAKKYQSRLESLITNLKRETDNKKLSFSVCRITSPSEQFPFTTTVRKAQESINVGGYSWFDCDSLTKGPDNLHYDTNGIVKLGELFAKSTQEIESSRG